jgi:[acyl-carrier-protein] S-malonyltransferase
VQAVCDAAKEAGAKRVRVLNVSGAWHSPLMASARERFAAAVAHTEVRLPAWTVISNVTARPYGSVAEIRECLIASLCARVRWHEAAVALTGYDADLIVECGASEVLAPMMKRLPQTAGRRVAHVGDADDLARLRATLMKEPA